MTAGPIISLSGGSYGYTRFLGAVSPTVGPGNLLAAFEYEKDDGPWDSPNGLDKYNVVARYTEGDSRNGFSVTFMGYENHWHSTDQIPQRAVESGRIGRFGFIEETDGGETYRYSGVFDWQRSGTNSSTRAIGYVQRTRPMTSWRSAWESLRVASGLPGVRFHDGRHTALKALQFLVVAVAGWINQQQRDVIDYLQEENRVLREHLAPRRLGPIHCRQRLGGMLKYYYRPAA